MKNYSKLSLPLLGLALTATAAQGAIIGQLGVLDDSTGLVAGDQYRLIFITSTTTNAASSDITTYNTFVQGVAAGSSTYANLGSATWNIVGSTVSVDARDNTGTNPNVSAGVPVYLMNGTTLFATNNADLWNGNSPVLAININENGGITNEDRVFTGSLPGGTRVTGTGDQPLGNDPNPGTGTGGMNIRTGRNDGVGNSGAWMTNFNQDELNQNSVFAMSEILTVPQPVPEPSSAALLGLGGLALVFRRRK